MTDIVERLRASARSNAGSLNMRLEDHILWQAADEIDRLRAMILDAREVDRQYNIAMLLQASFHNDAIKPNELALAEAPMFNDVLTIYADGSVKFGSGFTPDDAAQAFWKKVGEVAPFHNDPYAEIDRLRKEIEQLKVSLVKLAGIYHHQ